MLLIGVGAEAKVGRGSGRAGRLCAAEVELDYTLLVPAGVSARSFADLDRPGMRIAAVRAHASTLELELAEEPVERRTRIGRSQSSGVRCYV